MRNILLSLMLIAVVFIGVNVYAGNTPSLDATTTVAKANLFKDETLAGNLQSVNWETMVRSTVGAVNWSAIVLSNNSVNWAQVILPTAP